MGSENFSDFLIPLKFTLDEPSKKKFDAALGEVEKRFAAIGTAAGAAAVALGFAVREISKNLAQLAYAAERVGASSEELKALGTAAERVGIGAETAKSSLSGFFAFVNFEGGASAIKQWFKIDFDPKHPLKAMLDSAVQLADTYATGTVAQRQTAIREAQRAGINETLLTTPGAARRLRDEMAKDEAFTGGKFNPIAEKAKRLNSEFEKVKQHLQDIGQLATGPLQDAFSDLLETTDGWLKAHKDDIIWFSNKSAEITHELFAPNIKKFLEEIQPSKQQKEDFLAFTKKVGDAWKIVGDTYRSFWDGSIANKINVALEWAFQPFKWLWDKLQSLGLVGAGGGIGPSGGAPGGGPGSGRGGETSLEGGEGASGGSHAARERGARGRASGQRGAVGGGSRGGGGVPGSGPIAPAGSLTALITSEAQRAGIDPRIMEGIRAGESGHTSRYDVKDDALESSWGPFQLNRRRGLGAEFEKETGLDVRNPKTIPAQARWVAQYIKKHGGTNNQWMGYHGPRDANPHWGESGYQRNEVVVHKGSPDITAKPQIPASDFHKRLEEIRAAKPAAPWQQSMNEHHDNRIHNSNIEIKVAGHFPVDKTARPLERSKNADLIRNTTSTAA